ncbi:NotI family restriction endonuclease [Phytoactinopolyspora halotolerans]|uniref:Restriction endonuclease type II NotI domain-containing protein n=1 Tax=Phytoactinopolyspora halotolerans TaxID=1981512 RepID=A0A6L9SD70_9ACTN|nr:NotI family restriction endonuclease [Phytoactinopolyspora halotolerans]NEE03047.1 hypothetical protein [Phytoactinopolyspora halotolerans]
MSTTIFEFYGYQSTDQSPIALEHARDGRCPFILDTCEKTLRNGETSGVCSLKPATSGPVICCPIRLYADNYRILKDVCKLAFGQHLPLVPGAAAVYKAKRGGSSVVSVFGKRWGGELRLPQRQGRGSYFVDWILARLEPDGSLAEFVAVEVQSIDTTGNYQDSRRHLLESGRRVAKATAGFNWENVSKRILPQIIYKGNVLQREELCQKGLFFVTPSPVYAKVMQRLGGADGLLPYPLQSSSITFMAYDIDYNNAQPGKPLQLEQSDVFTTNIGQVAQAFAGPGVMPPKDCYREAIKQALGAVA